MRGVLPVVVVAVLALALPAVASADAAKGDVIEEIHVDLQFSGNYVGQDTQDRLQYALLDTLQLALMDQLEGDLEYISRHQQKVTSTIGKVIGDALSKRGFVMEELVLDAGPLTTVSIKLHLAEQQVSKFAVQFHLLGNSPIVENAIKDDVASVQNELQQRLASTPYNDTRWITALVTEVVDGYFADKPEYRDFDRLVTAQAGELTSVAVTFTPKKDAELLQFYSIKFHSITLPLLLLENTRHAADAYLGSLVGAPVSFITGKLNLIREALYRYLVNECEVVSADTDLTIHAELRGCLMAMQVDAVSNNLFAAGQARLDLWDRDMPDYAGRLRARLGYQPKPGWPVYADINYYPVGGEAYPLVGAGHLFGNNYFAGAGYDLNAETVRFQGLGYIDPDLYFEADIYSDSAWDDLSELSLHYRLKDIYEIQLVSSLGGDVFAAVAADL